MERAKPFVLRSEMERAKTFEFGPFYVRSEHLTMFILMLIIVLILHFFLYQTRQGLAIRALSDNPQASLYIGINRSKTLFLSFFIVSLLGGIAGFLILSTDSQITPFFGLWATFKGLIAMMLGGMGSLPGAIIGGLLLGIVEANVFWYGDPILRDISAYLLLFVMLVLRPGGIFGQSIVLRQRLAQERV